MQSHNPIALSLQELCITESYSFQNRNYTLYFALPSPPGLRPSGGAGILIRKDIPHSLLNLNTNIQALACRISTPQPITLCSVYLPPSKTWKAADLLSLVAQLPPPILFLGDFNAHNTLWGCVSTDFKGQEISEFMSSCNMCLLNDKTPTYIHPATGSHSSIDLAFCDPSLYLDFIWKVHDDLCGSDHLPIILTRSNTPILDDNQRWKLKLADWDSFSDFCTEEFYYDSDQHTTISMEEFTSKLLAVANKTIPKTSKVPRIVRKPWFSDDCKRAIAERKEALKQLKRSPNSTTLANLRVFRAKACRTIRINKRNSWRSFVSRLNSKTPMKKIWNMVKRISGKPTSIGCSHLKINGVNIEQPADIADSIASTISYNSSSDHYNAKFRRHKAHQERWPQHFTSDNNESYNQPFSQQELQTALNCSHDSAVGPDNVHYQMLKHLPDPALKTLLEIFNNIWLTGNFPTVWSEATIIPIPKPGKDHTDPNNYRPIALTSCICKTFERIVNYRLVWFLEKNKLFTEFQSGFRKQRNTNDHLIRLESFIREGFVRREHVVSVFFDLEKAYDTTWKYGILQDLHNCGLRG